MGVGPGGAAVSIENPVCRKALNPIGAATCGGGSDCRKATPGQFARFGLGFAFWMEMGIGVMEKNCWRISRLGNKEVCSNSSRSPTRLSVYSRYLVVCEVVGTAWDTGWDDVGEMLDCASWLARKQFVLR